MPIVYFCFLGALLIWGYTRCVKITSSSVYFVRRRYLSYFVSYRKLTLGNHFMFPFIDSLVKRPDKTLLSYNERKTERTLEAKVVTRDEIALKVSYVLTYRLSCNLEQAGFIEEFITQAGYGLDRDSCHAIIHVFSKITFGDTGYSELMLVSPPMEKLYSRPYISNIAITIKNIQMRVPLGVSGTPTTNALSKYFRRYASDVN